MYRPSQTPRLTLSSEGIVMQYVGIGSGTRESTDPTLANRTGQPREPYESKPLTYLIHLIQELWIPV